jgi:hypothetical protein
MFAVVLMTGLGAFFLVYASIFVRPGPTAVFIPLPVGTPGRIQAEMPVIISLMSYLLTTALIIAPLLFTLSANRRPARGIVTLLVVAAAWLPVVMIGLRPYSIAGAAGATVAAVVADLLLTRVPDEWLGRLMCAQPSRKTANSSHSPRSSVTRSRRLSVPVLRAVSSIVAHFHGAFR